MNIIQAKAELFQGIKAGDFARVDSILHQKNFNKWVSIRAMLEALYGLDTDPSQERGMIAARLYSGYNFPKDGDSLYKIFVDFAVPKTFNGYFPRTAIRWACENLMIPQQTLGCIFVMVCRNGDLELAKHVNLYIVNNIKYMAALQSAVVNGRIDIVDWILSEYVDIPISVIELILNAANVEINIVWVGVKRVIYNDPSKVDTIVRIIDHLEANNINAVICETAMKKIDMACPMIKSAAKLS
jgi:hypothetical protein